MILAFQTYLKHSNDNRPTFQNGSYKFHQSTTTNYCFSAKLPLTPAFKVLRCNSFQIDMPLNTSLLLTKSFAILQIRFGNTFLVRTSQCISLNINWLQLGPSVFWYCQTGKELNSHGIHCTHILTRWVTEVKELRAHMNQESKNGGLARVWPCVTRARQWHLCCNSKITSSAAIKVHSFTR